MRQPRVRDRGAVAKDAGRIRFTSAILPPYARRSRGLEVLIPILYLKGVSTGDFEDALAALLGKDAGLSPSTIARLKETWIEEHARWKKRDLSARRYVYVWADGVPFEHDGARHVFKLIEAAEKSWRRLDGHIQLPKVVLGVRFTDGLEVETANPQPKAAA